jgi:hypothetical protein
MSKTIKDLEELKNTKDNQFGTRYNLLLCAMENAFIAKMDGLSRIKYELENWDIETRKIITVDLADKIQNSGIMSFDRYEILRLGYMEDAK